MWITSLAVRRPLVVIMAFVAVALMGVLAYSKLGASLYPNTNLPYIFITTEYPGGSPEDVETFVSKPIEDAVAGLQGLKHISSTSAEGLSYITLEFDITRSADNAASDTERALATVTGLPDGTKTPAVRKTDFAGPVMNISLVGNLPADQLFTLVDQKIQGRLEAVTGVSQVKVIGGHEREIQVQFDPRKLQAYGLGVDQLHNALASENVTIPGGQLDAAGKEYNTRLIGLYRNPNDLLNLAVAVRPSGTVYLRDVAKVEDTTKKTTLLYRADGQNAIGLVVSKTSDANMVDVSRDLRKELGRLQKELPAGVRLVPSYDGAVFIHQSLDGVQENLIEAILLTGLVLLLFLHTWRSTAIVLLAIPTSLIATYAVMYVAGFSINLLTLLALGLSIGVLVDDSIVVLENIFRHLERGQEPRTAAIEGRSEIGAAALAITLVDVVVYTPLGFLTGIVGQFFREFGFTMVAAVLFSLIVSFTLTPMLASRWLRGVDGAVRSTGLMARFGKAWDAGFQRLERVYERVLAWSLDHRKTVAGLSLASILISVAYFPLGLLGTEFVPNADQGVFNIQAEMPAGTELTVTDTAARTLEAKLRTIPEVSHILTSVGVGNQSGFQEQDSANRFEMTVLLKDRNQRQRLVPAILPDVNAVLKSIPGLTARAELPSTSGNSQPLVIDIRGDEPDRLASYAAQIETVVKGTPGATDVTNSLSDTSAELDATVDHARAADLGVTSAQAAAVLRAGLTGDVATQLRPAGQKQVDVRLISQAGSATTVADLAALPIISRQGNAIRLDQVAKIETVDSAPQVNRRDRQRVINIGASLSGTRPLGEVTSAVQQGIAKLHIPASYTVEFNGDTQLQSDSFSSFGIAILLGMALMYMLMAALFESLMYPLAVMFSVPVSLFGAFTALAVLRENLGLFSLVGLIMLMGLVTKNAILVIDFTEKMRAQGMSRREALLHAGPIRLRPILMTSATMVVSMLPLALKLTVGAESRASIGAVVAGGMLSSTLLSLILVPVVYSSLDEMKERLGDWVHRLRRTTPTGSARPAPVSLPEITPARPAAEVA